MHNIQMVFIMLSSGNCKHIFARVYFRLSTCSKIKPLKPQTILILKTISLGNVHP